LKTLSNVLANGSKSWLKKAATSNQAKCLICSKKILSDGEASYEYPREQPIVAMFEVHNTPEMLQLMSDLQQHQTDDPVLRPIIENKRSGGAAPDSRTRRVWAQYNLTNNVLVHRSQNSNDDCIAVPESLVTKLVATTTNSWGISGQPKCTTR
jgi:hypothetical protein